MNDSTEDVRRALVVEGDTSELAKDFEVMGFAAPFVVVRRKADNQIGSLMFQNQPRYFFLFQEHR